MCYANNEKQKMTNDEGIEQSNQEKLERLEKRNSQILGNTGSEHHQISGYEILNL